MDWLQPIAVSKFLLFTLVLARVSGLVVTAPIFGSVEVPAQVRALLALALAVLIMPTQWHVLVADPGNLLNYLLLLSGELVIGLVLGLGVMILFSGAQLAGEAFGRISGLMLADLFDPSLGVSVPVFSRLLFLLALTIFVTIGGHRVVMAGLLDTFATIPPGSGLAPVSLYGTIEELVTLSFVLGSAKRSARSSVRLPLYVSFLANGGRLNCEFVFWMWAISWPRWRTKWLRRRSRSRVWRLARG